MKKGCSTCKYGKGVHTLADVRPACYGCGHEGENINWIPSVEAIREQYQEFIEVNEMRI